MVLILQLYFFMIYIVQAIIVNTFVKIGLYGCLNIQVPAFFPKFQKHTLNNFLGMTVLMQHHTGIGMQSLEMCFKQLFKSSIIVRQSGGFVPCEYLFQVAGSALVLPFRLSNTPDCYI